MQPASSRQPRRRCAAGTDPAKPTRIMAGAARVVMRARLFGEGEAELACPGPLPARLRRYGRPLLHRLTSDEMIRAHRVMLGALENAPEPAVCFAEATGRDQAILRRALQAEIDAGRLQVADVELACNPFFGLCQAGLFRWRLPRVMPQAPTEDEIARHVNAAVEIFLNFHGNRPLRDGCPRQLTITI